MSREGSPRLVDSFTAPKEVLKEFEELAEEDNFDPFEATAKKKQIAARQSDYQNKRFDRQANESADAFKAAQEGTDVEGGYRDAMRLQMLEKEEERVRRAIEEKEKREREEGIDKAALDKTPPAAELEAAEKELQAIAASMAGTKRKRRWDVSESADDKENQDISAKADTGEWSKEALENAAPKKRRSRWDATPAEAGVAETPKRSRWDQAPAPEAPQPMALHSTP